MFSIQITRWRQLAASAFLILSAGQVLAEPGADHEAVARFPGAVMQGYDYREYEEAQLILSRPQYRSSAYMADKTLAVEGRVTYLHYEAPKSASALQVFRNYQSALKRSGFSELFVCERPCFENNLGDLGKLMKARNLYLNGHQDNQYLAAQRGNTYVSLWVNTMGEPNIWLFVIDKEKLDDGLMEVRGNSNIARALSSEGKVDLYGFQFDTGKAVLREGSQATLKELIQVLQENPALNVSVVGHTDDVGQADANQKLSEARARAVSDALVAQGGISAARIEARGAGQTEPLLPNTDDAARAKNRRVAIMARKPAASTQASQSPRPAARANNPATSTTTPDSADTSAGNKPAAPEKSVSERANELLDTANKLRGLFGR